MTKLSERSKNIPPSATLALNTLAKQMQKQGKQVINLTAGEPDLPTSANIIDAAKEALDRGETRYSAVAGLMELREAVATNYSKDYGTPLSAEQVIISNGAKHSLAALMQTILDDGDEVIVPAPYWLSYPHMVRVAGGVAKILTLSSEQDFQIDPQALSKLISKRTKAIIVNSPANPIGTLQKRETLLSAIDATKHLDLYWIFDDIYQKFIYDDASWVSAYSLADLPKEKIIAVGGVSKSYAMTGFRIGWLIADKEIVQSMSRLQSHTASGACTVSQWAALEAVSGSQQALLDMRTTFNKRRKLLKKALDSLPGVSCPPLQGAFYAFPDFSSYLKGSPWQSSAELATYLLEKALVATVPGEAFGGDGHLRISYAASEQNLIDGVKRIAEALDR